MDPSTPEILAEDLDTSILATRRLIWRIDSLIRMKKVTFTNLDAVLARCDAPADGDDLKQVLFQRFDYYPLDARNATARALRHIDDLRRTLATLRNALLDHRAAIDPQGAHINSPSALTAARQAAQRLLESASAEERGRVDTMNQHGQGIKVPYIYAENTRQELGLPLPLAASTGDLPLSKMDMGIPSQEDNAWHRGLM